MPATTMAGGSLAGDSNVVVARKTGSYNSDHGWRIAGRWFYMAVARKTGSYASRDR